MKEHEKRFRIEFTVDVHYEGVTKEWDLSNDDIKEIVEQELDCMSPYPFDITFSEVENPWHTGTPTEEGWYLLHLREDKAMWKDKPFCVAYMDGHRWLSINDFFILVDDVIAWQKIEPFKASN